MTCIFWKLASKMVLGQDLGNFQKHFLQNFRQDFPQHFPQNSPQNFLSWILIGNSPSSIPNAKFPPITAWLNRPTYHKSAKVSHHLSPDLMGTPNQWISWLLGASNYAGYMWWYWSLAIWTRNHECILVPYPLWTDSFLLHISFYFSRTFQQYQKVFSVPLR